MNTKLLTLRRVSPLRSSVRSALLIAMVVSLVWTAPAHAASLVVNTLEDELNSDGDCSLREAIQAANDNLAVDACPAGEAGSLDEISFAVNGTITLSAQLEVTAGGPLSIKGANAVEISGSGTVRVMFVNSDAVVRLEDLAISNGGVEAATPPICSSSYCGGGIYSTGTLALDRVVLVDHNAGAGGGIYNGGTLNISDSAISGNEAGSGGGIYNSGTLDVTGGIISNNDGGGIYNSGTLTISNSTMSGNRTDGEGGGIESSGPLTIIDSTISGNHSQRFGGGISSYGTSTITNSTLNGNSAYRFGGAMINGGTTTITDSTVSNNSGDFGVGGILNFSRLTISHSNMQDNYAYGECGGSFNTGTLTVTNNSRLAGSGICNVGTLDISNSIVLGSQIFNAEWTEILGIMVLGGPGIMTIRDSSLSGNGAFQGGGILNVGTLHVTNSSLSGNTAQQGGGIYNAEIQESSYSYGPGILTLTNSILSGNTASQGGGIYNLGTLHVTSSTVSGNFAYDAGGGVYNAARADDSYGPGILALSNSTLSGNSTYGIGGGIYNDLGALSLYSSIVAASPLGGNCAGSMIDAGYNIEDADTCSLIPSNGSLTDTDPLLGQLGDNGGPTLTHALLPGSPAIDAGDPLDCPETDQRGVARTLDGNSDGLAVCDIGAYEAGIVATVDITPNVIRLPSKGQWMIGYIELPAGFNVAAIDLSTVRLQRTIPAANPLSKVGDHDKDGNPDIMVQFSQQALLTQLSGVTGEVTLLVTGTLRDGTPFEGWDTIVISQKK